MVEGNRMLLSKGRFSYCVVFIMAAVKYSCFSPSPESISGEIGACEKIRDFNGVFWELA